MKQLLCKFRIHDHGRLRANVAATVAMLAIASMVSNTWAQIVFDPAVSYAVGQRPSGVASADFDGDNDNDFAVTTDGANGNLDLIEIYLNDGNGTFSPGPVIFLPNSSSPNDLIAADLDGDMDPDMAVVLEDFQQVQIVINNGGGVFSLGSTATVGDRAQGLTARDYDSDNDMDLAVANRNDNTATILTNSGVGTFSSLTLAAGNEPRTPAFVNIDGNIDIDFAVTNHDDRSISLFTNSGGVFSPAGTLSVGGVHRPDGLVAADLNGDGLDDLAAAISDDNLPDAAMVFLNTGGSFGGGAMYPTSGVNSSTIIAADLDCDGALDLVTSNQDSNNLSVLENQGAGSFGAATLLATDIRPGLMFASDLDGDTDEDLGVANRDSNSVTVYMNQSCDPVTVFAQNLNVILGTIIGGQLSDVDQSDDNYLRFLRGNSFSITSPSIWLEFDGTLPTDTPSSLSITLEANTNSNDITQKIEMFNWITNEFELVDSRAASFNVDSTAVVELQGDLTRYVELGTGAVKTKVTYTQGGMVIFLGWQVAIDQFIWQAQ